MRWTSQPPSMPGWYWWRQHGINGSRDKVVYVFDCGYDLYVNGYGDMSTLTGLWSSSPIPQPEGDT